MTMWMCRIYVIKSQRRAACRRRFGEDAPRFRVYRAIFTCVFVALCVFAAAISAANNKVHSGDLYSDRGAPAPPSAYVFVLCNLRCYSHSPRLQEAVVVVVAWAVKGGGGGRWIS